MQLLDKTTLLNAIDAALIVNHEIEVIDKNGNLCSKSLQL
jgi:hypothetical protein